MSTGGVRAGIPACLKLSHRLKVAEHDVLTLSLRGPTKLTGTLVAGGAGRIEARFTVRRAGEYELEVKDSSGKILLHDALTVRSGPVHTASCTPLPSTDPFVLVLQARDSHGNAVRCGGACFVAGLVGDPLVVGGRRVRDCEDGTYEISLTGGTPGPQLLRVRQEGREARQAGGEAQASAQAAAQADCELKLPVYLPKPTPPPREPPPPPPPPPLRPAGAWSAVTSRVTGEGLEGAVAGEWRSLLVCLCDAAGTPCTDGAHTITLRAAPLARDTATAPPAAAPPAAAPPAAGWARARDALLQDNFPRDAVPLRPDECRFECVAAAGGQYALRYYLTRAVPHALSIHAVPATEQTEQGHGAHGTAPRTEYSRWLAGECEGAASPKRSHTSVAGHKAGRALQRAVAWGEEASGPGGEGGGPGGAAARRQAWSSGGEAGEEAESEGQQEEEEDDGGGGGGGTSGGGDGLEHASVAAVRSFELEVCPGTCCLHASAQQSKVARQVPFGSALIATVPLRDRYSNALPASALPPRLAAHLAAHLTACFRRAHSPPRTRPATAAARARGVGGSGSSIALGGAFRHAADQAAAAAEESKPRRPPPTPPSRSASKSSLAAAAFASAALAATAKPAWRPAPTAPPTAPPAASGAERGSDSREQLDSHLDSHLGGEPPNEGGEGGEGGEAVVCEVGVEAAALRLTAKGVPCGHWRLSLHCSDACSYGRGDAPMLVQVQPGALEAACCEASGSGITHAVLGKTASFTVTARDADGNRRRVARGAREGKCPFRVAIVTAPGLIDARITPRADGSYRVSYVPFGGAGMCVAALTCTAAPLHPCTPAPLHLFRYVVAVTYAAKPIAGSPFRIQVGAADRGAAAALGLVGGARARPSTAPVSRGGGGGGGDGAGTTQAAAVAARRVLAHAAAARLWVAAANKASRESKDGASTPLPAAWRAVPAPPRGMARGAVAIAAHNARRARPATAAPAKRPCPVAPAKKPEKLAASPWPMDLGGAPQHRVAPSVRQQRTPGSAVVAS